MGCDIHSFIEVQADDGTWGLYFPVTYDDWAFEQVVERMVSDGTAQTFTGTPDDDEAEKKMKAYLLSLPHEEVLEKYGPRGEVYLEFNTPGELESRHYHWFNRLAGVRGREPVWEPRGVPDDLNPYVRGHYDYWDQDAHTPSWQLASELCGSEIMQQEFPEKLKVFDGIPYPKDRIRFFYFFDN